ncbi:uncharacterized protein JCM10292_002039 [Rhodotorula paludigena]|uniref:uncharacterized protein n=1 Tax=Rhodotorula paludigena TaxID=86838 RepID=UPI00317EE070
MADDDKYAFAIPPPGDDDAPAPARPRSTDKLKADKPSKKRKSLSRDESAPAPRSGAPAEAAPAQDDAAQEGSEAVKVDDEERPLSHKERRLAKKRKLAAEQAGDDAPAPAAPAVPARPAAPAQTTIGSTLVGNTPSRSAHGVWVGNLNFATHPRELLAWFADRGLQEVTRINMPGGKRTHENNRGFAYLDFPAATDVTIAVALSEQHLDGRKLLIKSSSDFSGRPAAAPAAPGASGGAVKDVLSTLDASALEKPHPSTVISASAAHANGDGAAPPTLNRTARKILLRQKNPAGPTLFLGNLGFETTVDDIRDMFDRNQRRSSEWARGGTKDKREKKGKGKGKGKAVEGDAEEGEDAGEGEAEEKEDADTDRDEDDSDSDSDSDADSESDSEEPDAAGGKKDKRKEKKDKGPLDLAKAKDAGIRKVRLGTFEDTGKCKGWAFVDFHLPAQATRALLNLHNHQLNGRKLNVEYASADAVRRGALGSRAAGRANNRARQHAHEDGDGAEDGGDDFGGARGAAGAGRKRAAPGEWDGDMRALAAEAAAGAYDAPPRRQQQQQRGGAPRAGGFDAGARRGGDRDGPQGGAGGKRLKPGAALANAQRASEAIVASTGRKTTFD